MSGVIDIIVGKNVEGQIDKLVKQLDGVYTKIGEINKTGLDLYDSKNASNSAELKKLIDSYTKLSAEQAKVSKQAIDLAIKEERLAQAQNRTTISNNSLEKSTISLEKARDNATKAQEREMAKLQASTSYYNQIQQKMNSLIKVYNDLALKKQLNNKLSDQEEANLKDLQQEIKKYDTALKAVDANVGKHTREVGNYAKANSQLSGSINQLTREMPAFANSAQTGFMAISNNIPIFFDAISNTRKQIKLLKDEGKEVPSLFSQLTSSIFSWGTALSVGVTLLTIYGKEIVNFIGSLFGASEAIKELNKNQEEFNNARFQGKKDAQSDIIELKKYLAVYNDTSLSVKDRDIAYKKLSDQYAYYIKNVKDATITNGQYSAGVKKLLVDLEKQKALEKETDLQVKNKQKLLDLQKELSKLKELEIKKENDLGLALKNNLSSQGLATLSNELSRIQSKRIKTQSDVNAYQSKINQNEIDIIRLTKERIGLDYKEKKEREKKIRDIEEINIKQQNYLARENDLRKQVLENLIKNNKQAFEDESLNLKERGKAYENYLNFRKQLLLVEYENENRIINKEEKDQKEEIVKQYNDQLKKIKKALSEGTATRSDAENKTFQASKEKNEAIYALERKITADRNILTEKFVQNQKELNDEYTRDVLFKLIQSLDILDKKIIEQRKTLSEKTYLNYDISELFDGKKLKVSIKQYEEFFKDVERKSFESEQNRIKNEIKIVEDKMRYITDYESEEYEKLDSEKLSLEIDLQNKITEERRKSAEEAKKIQEEINNYLKGFVDSFASENGLTSVFKILNNEIKGFGENAQVTVNATLEAFQELYNMLNRNSAERFKSESDRLDREKELSIGMAGDSSKAKEEIEKRFDEKKRQLRKKEAQEQKQLAIFNIGINTSQAIVSALPKIPLSIAVGLIGAAQLALVLSKPLPEFWTGTDNAPKGFAHTQEKGREIITDSNYNIKSWGSDKGARIDYLQKGDKVINADKTRKFINELMFRESLNSLLLENTISPINFSDNSKESYNFKALENEIIDLKNIVKNKQSITIINDELGQRIYEEKQGSRKRLINNRVSINGFDI